MNVNNIKVLAEMLGLSTSTVSRAFRDKSDIKQATKERILAMAKDLNYQPNLFASNLRDKKSKTIAIIVPELANNYFSKVINGIEQVTTAKGYHILVYATGDDFQKEVSIIKHLHSGRVDGIIMSATGEANDHTYLNDFGQNRLPLVFFDRIYEDIEAPNVITNDYDSSFEGTEYLIAQGAQKIACLVRNRSLSIGKSRVQGYIDALMAHQIPFDENLIINCSNDLEENKKIIAQMVSSLHPDALFASVERLAFASYYVCKDLNLRIPQDIKVLGFSSLDLAPLLSPALSTITQPATQIGLEAANLIFQVLENKENESLQHQKIVLKSELIPRKSTENI